MFGKPSAFAYGKGKQFGRKECGELSDDHSQLAEVKSWPTKVPSYKRMGNQRISRLIKSCFHQSLVAHAHLMKVERPAYINKKNLKEEVCLFFYSLISCFTGMFKDL